jgi:type VI secretion system protein ImpA
MAAEPSKLALLLAPIPGSTPIGADLREDYTPQSVYYRLRDARSDARAAERAGDADPNAAAEAGQHWREVANLAEAALGGQSKDVEVAAWLTEALVRRDGLAGLAFGARLIEGLADRFWDALYPRPDEDGLATLVAPVTGLNGEGGDGTLIQPLRKQALFTRPDGTRLLFFQYRQAEDVAGIGDETRRLARIAAGAAEFATLDAEAKAAGPQAFAALSVQLEEAILAWAALAQRFEQKAGDAAPPTGRVAGLLAEMRDVLRRYCPQAPEGEAPADVPVHALSIQDDVPDPRHPDGAPGDALTREEALRQLAALAAFFRRTEPQSPISLTIEEAIRRARMSWPELLADIIADQPTRHAMLLALGIRPE